MAKVSFDAARLVINPVFLFVLFGELLDDRPGTRPHGWICKCRDVFKRGWPGASPALDQVQVLARAAIVGFRTEVGHVDNERVALPMAARVAEPLTDVGRQVRASVHDDVALPPLALTHVVSDRNAAWRLHDAAEAAAAVAGAKLRQPEGQAAVGQRAVFWTIMTVYARGVVARRKLVPSLNGRGRIVLAAGTRRQA